MGRIDILTLVMFSHSATWERYKSTLQSRLNQFAKSLTISALGIKTMYVRFLLPKITVRGIQNVFFVNDKGCKIHSIKTESPSPER